MRMLSFTICGFVLLTLAGCGAGLPQPVASATTLSMQAGTPLTITIADNNYNNVTITQNQGTPLANLGWQCTGGQNTYLQCSKATGGYGGYGGGTYGSEYCSTQQPCYAQFSANRGGQIAYVNITITQ
jgi:hypothetical protein